MRENAAPGKSVENRKKRPDPSTLSPALSMAEKDYQEDALLNDSGPRVLRKTETPQDILMVYLKAQGATNKAIAEQLGVTPATVSNSLKQPHSRKRLMKILHERGVEQFDEIVSGALNDSAFTVIDIMNDEKATRRDRLSAAAIIMDRAKGKPTQNVEMRTGKIDARPEAIDSELERLEQQLAHVQGATKN